MVFFLQHKQHWDLELELVPVLWDDVGRPICFLDPCIQIEFKRENKNIITRMRTVMKRIQYGNVPEIRIHVGLI